MRLLADWLAGWLALWLGGYVLVAVVIDVGVTTLVCLRQDPPEGLFGVLVWMNAHEESEWSPNIYLHRVRNRTPLK